jgi:hypothetical protein
MYVDDIFGVCLDTDLDEELRKTKQLVEGLMGPGAIAEDKTVVDRRLPVIGYDIDLDTELVAIAEKNVLKAVYGFLSVDLEAPIEVRYLEKLASWASRYGGICVEMLPLCKILYSEYKGLQHNAFKVMSLQAKRAVRIFRVLIIMTALDETRFARSMWSFCPARAQYVIEFDGSLYGAGLIWYGVQDGEEVLLGGCAVDFGDMGFGDNSENQNTAEFITLLLGIRGLMVMGHLGGQQVSVHLRGDSVTALTWAHTGRFRSVTCMNAATLFVLQNQIVRVVVSSVEHIPAEENQAADFLSRGLGRVPLLAAHMRDAKFSGLREIDLREGPMLALAKPAFGPESEEEFEGMWRRLRAAISTVD